MKQPFVVRHKAFALLCQISIWFDVTSNVRKTWMLTLFSVREKNGTAWGFSNAYIFHCVQSDRNYLSWFQSLLIYNESYLFSHLSLGHLHIDILEWLSQCCVRYQTLHNIEQLTQNVLHCDVYCLSPTWIRIWLTVEI